MNLRFFAVNVGVVFLLIITGAQLLFSDSDRSLVVGGVVFLISLVTGIYLIGLSNRERLALEKTTVLNKKIKKINEDLKEANEKLKSLDKLKSEFISLASHQLRSPLTVIKGYASTLTDGVVGEMNPKQTEIVRHIYTSAQGLASLVEDFLSVTKIEQGGMKYIFEEVSAKEIVEDLAGDMKLVAEDKQLSFTCNVDHAESYLVNADKVKLKQVFLNLIDNSIKYTKKGFVKVDLTKDPHAKTITFSVSDSGVGISLESRKRLFTKFGRGEAAPLNSGGSGLGLYLAWQIVKAHHGEIVVESEGEGKGSIFSVTLPTVV
jgi:signal transduction histidine kinase